MTIVTSEKIEYSSERTELQQPISLLQVLPFDGVIRDVIYDYIPYIKDVESPIIDTWVLQRLRYLYQLQLAHLVYPSATHTRFNHSLGVMHVAYKFMSQLLSRLESIKNSLPREHVRVFINKPKEILIATRVAGLLHDIGHGPFSHSFDKFVLRNREYLGYVVGNHEILGYIIYRDYLRDYIKNVLTSYGGLDVEFVLELLDEAIKPPYGAREYIDLEKKGLLTPSDYYVPQPNKQTHRLVRMIVRDFLYPADIIDYLVRDSYFTKAPIGVINTDWLIIQTYIISHEMMLQPAIANKAIDDLVRMLNARRFMYKHVYLHPVNIAFDETLGILLNCDELKSFISQVIDNMLSGKLHYYKALTDYSIYGILHRWNIEEDLSKYCGDMSTEAKKALKSLFEYRKPLWKKLIRLEFDKEKTRHLFGKELGRKFRGILESRIKEELASKFGSKGVSENDFKLLIQSIDPYPSAAKEISEYIYIAKTIRDRAIDFYIQRLDDFVKEHGIRGEALFTLYLDREKYEKINDVDLKKIIEDAERIIREAIGEIEEKKLPETS